MSWLSPIEIPKPKPLPKRMKVWQAKALPVVVRGKRYKSVREASAALGLTWRKIYQMLDEGKAKRA
ncbi:MAG TPA: hypothetical protein VFU31_24860 [Candidatus Binatia bacterium]|nr:hypothetical protein [Candidatus Binatia bacterium]